MPDMCIASLIFLRCVEFDVNIQQNPGFSYLVN